MHSSWDSFLFAGLMSLRLASTSPLPSSHLLPRQLVDCNDLSTTPDPTCWGILNVSSYLITNWTATATTCTDQTDDSTCCAVGEPWANCFIRLAMGPPDGTSTSSSDGTIHCDTIGTATCPNEFTIKVVDYPAQARYVVIAIKCKALPH